MPARISVLLRSADFQRKQIPHAKWAAKAFYFEATVSSVVQKGGSQKGNRNHFGGSPKQHVQIFDDSG